MTFLTVTVALCLVRESDSNDSAVVTTVLTEDSDVVGLLEVGLFVLCH
jgi:hypothetical protein